jgi:hypothetical protein
VAAEVPKVAVPASPFISVVYKYADTMVDRGRDTYGPLKSGLFLSALDRASVMPMTNRPPAPPGVRERDRVGSASDLAGASLQHDQNLFRLLYLLSELSGKPKYRTAADEALRFYLERPELAGNSMVSLGRQSSWEVLSDRLGNFGGDELATKQARPWLLWSRCFHVAPQASSNLVIAEMNLPQNPRSVRSPRQVGFWLRTWAESFAATGATPFLRKMTELIDSAELSEGTATAGGTSKDPPAFETAGLLSLAIDCAGAAHHVPEPLASRLRSCAERQDKLVCGLSHDLARTSGFLVSSRDPTRTSGSYTALWDVGAGRLSTAQVALMCVARYENLGLPGYRALIHAAADLYRAGVPTNNPNIWPLSVGQAISLQLAAWRSTANPAYLQCARELGDFAVTRFFAGAALPRASLDLEHYEAITGADTLALGLAELHLHILAITAVRCPSNTLDR